MNKKDDDAPVSIAPTKTPDEWRNEFGPDLAPRWLHAAAEVLHGWRLHAHHENKLIQLRRADYEKALAAASHPAGEIEIADRNHEPLRRTSYQPHRSAQYIPTPPKA